MDAKAFLHGTVGVCGFAGWGWGVVGFGISEDLFDEDLDRALGADVASVFGFGGEKA